MHGSYDAEPAKGQIQPEISVIVPVYGTEQYLPACLESILACRSIPLEVIVVDDASPGNVQDICARMREMDWRICFLRNGQNLGLLRTRLRGIRASRGRYIAFVDSDDVIDPGFLSGLYAALERTGADIAVGRTVRRTSRGEYVYSLHEDTMRARCRDGKEVRRAYFEQEGHCYSWHTVWNKLYRRSCWEKSLQWFHSFTGRVTMNEDLCLSTQIYAQSPRMCFVPGAPYYYCEREGAATDTGGDSTRSILDKLEEVGCALAQAEGFLRHHLEGDPDRGELMRHFEGCRRHYAGIWGSILRGRLLSGPQKAHADRLLAAIAGGEHSETVRPYAVTAPDDPGYFERLRLPWSGRTAYLAERIREGSECCVSFDLFDTLLMRPFSDPKDLFRLLDAEYGRRTGSAAPFHTLRCRAEEQCRRRIRGDVTLKEIYDQLRERYGLEESVAEGMMEEELRWELRCVMPRETGRSLLETALSSGKRVILVTDMYLPRSQLCAMLHTCGITDTLPLYISSEERRLKTQGLFRTVLRKEGLKGGDLLHIGDNWQADILAPQKLSISTVYLPSAADACAGAVQGQPPLRRSRFGSGLVLTDPARNALWDPGTSAAMAMAVRRYWDDPYRDLQGADGLGGDPFYLGYCLLGPLLLGILGGILEEADKRNSREILFLQRDADLPMRAMEILSACVPGLPAIRSMPLSRGVLLPWMVTPADSFAALPVVPENYSPAAITELLAPLSGDLVNGPVTMTVTMTGTMTGRMTGPAGDRPFRTEEEYCRYLFSFREQEYDRIGAQESAAACSAFLEGVTERTLLFDIGYSGRIPEAVCRATGRRVPALYLLGSPDLADRTIAGTGDRVPVSVLLPGEEPACGPLLEYYFAGDDGACTGLSRTGEPQNRMRRDRPEAAAIRSAVRRAALEYAEDWCRLFGDRSASLLPVCAAAAGPAMDFMRHFPESEEDCTLMKYACLEDSFYAASDNVPLLSLYRDRHSRPCMDGRAGSEAGRSLDHRGKRELFRGTLPVRALRMLLHDPDMFRDRVCQRARDLLRRG